MNIIISSSSQTPIYQQIFEQVRDAIINGILAQGVIMPSIRSLAKDLKISVITTKRAYEELEREGLIVTMPGKGTFVAPCSVEMMREARLKEIEQHFETATNLGKSIGLDLNAMKDILEAVFEEVDL